MVSRRKACQIEEKNLSVLETRQGDKMEWKVGNISMLRKEAKLGERKLVCLLLDLVRSKNSLCFFVMLHTTPSYALSLPFSSHDLTLPKQKSKEKPIYISKQIQTRKSKAEQYYISVSYFVTYKKTFQHSSPLPLMDFTTVLQFLCVNLELQMNQL